MARKDNRKAQNRKPIKLKINGNIEASSSSSVKPELSRPQVVEGTSANTLLPLRPSETKPEPPKALLKRLQEDSDSEEIELEPLEPVSYRRDRIHIQPPSIEINTDAIEIHSPEANRHAFEFILSFIGTQDEIMPEMSEAGIQMIINQFQKIYLVCPYTQEPLESSLKQPSFLSRLIRKKEEKNMFKDADDSLTTLEETLNKYIPKPSIFLILFKEKRQARFAEKIDALKVILTVCPKQFMETFEKRNVLKLFATLGNLLNVPLKDRQFEKQQMAPQKSFSNLISVMAQNEMWRDYFIQSQELGQICKSLCLMAFNHTQCKPWELINEKEGCNMNLYHVPSYFNKTAKIPPLDLRLSIIKIFSDIILYSGSENDGWKSINETMKHNVGDVDVFDLWFNEFKTCSWELWRVWSGLITRAKEAFFEVDTIFFRTDSVWRNSAIHKEEIDLMEDYLYEHLKFLEMWLVWAPRPEKHELTKKLEEYNIYTSLREIEVCPRQSYKKQLRLVLHELKN